MRLGNFLRMLAAAAIAAALASEVWMLSTAYRETQTCRDALPALEDSGDLIVGALKRDAALPSVYEIDYWVTGASPRPGKLRCAFGEAPDGDRRLVGLELGGWPIGDARLILLERFWLGDAEAVREGARRIRDVVPRMELLDAVIGRPHPSLIAAIVCALLAVVFEALGRRRETRSGR